MPHILNKSQAEAVYSAMCALNNVGARIRDMGDYENWSVTEYRDGAIAVFGASAPTEHYAGQSAFATAYGLDSDGPQSDVDAAAGGLTQTAIEH